MTLNLAEKTEEALMNESKRALLEEIHNLITTHKNSLYAKDINELSEALYNLDSLGEYEEC